MNSANSASSPTIGVVYGVESGQCSAAPIFSSENEIDVGMVDRNVDASPPMVVGSGEGSLAAMAGEQ